MTLPARRATPALLQISAILTRLSGDAALQEVCRYLRAEFEHFEWVGVYRREGEVLKLAGWDGAEATEHTEIPVAQGLCGLAVRENRSVVVGDVTARPEYLACFASTRSEVVVPVRIEGEAVGEIDVDGSKLNGFDSSDARFLEAVAEKIAPHVGTRLLPMGP